MGKGEIAHNEHILFFPQCFLPYRSISTHMLSFAVLAFFYFFTYSICDVVVFMFEGWFFKGFSSLENSLAGVVCSSDTAPCNFILDFCFIFYCVHKAIQT